MKIYQDFKYVLQGLWRLFVYTVFVTTMLTLWDWQPIHQSWQEHQYFPDKSVYTWWEPVHAQRAQVGYWLGAWNLALAENNYFSYFEMEASLAEQGDLLTKHAPYTNPLVAGNGYLWMGQGGDGNNNPWKPVSEIAFYLYFLPSTVLWFVLLGEVFWLRWPWWIRLAARLFLRVTELFLEWMA